MTHYLTPSQQALLVEASKTPGTEADRLKAIDEVVEVLHLMNPKAFAPEATINKRWSR